MALRLEDEFLLVDEGDRLPKVCLKCGATEGITRHLRHFNLGGRSAAGAGMGAGAAGAVVAMTVRNSYANDPAMQATILGGVMGLIAVVGFALHVRADKIGLDIPLCAECGKRLEDGLRLRSGFIVFALACGVLMLWGIGSSNLTLAGLSMLLLFGAAFATRAMGLPHRLVVHGWAKGSTVALRVGPEIARDMVRRAERRAARAAESKDSD